MRIGVLTGGGDVPGLNACIAALASAAAERGWTVVGFRRGWAGPLRVDPDDPATVAENTLNLTRGLLRDAAREGGTLLQTSRTNPGRVSPGQLPPFLVGRETADAVDCTSHVLRVLDALGIDALVAIGGDDTLSYADRLRREGMTVMGCPKTMDNDVHGTDYCIGFGTAVSRSVAFIDDLRTPAASHERIAVVELFGRNSGETALMTGYLAGADRVLISEAPFDADRLAGLVEADCAGNPSGYAVVVVSEGARMTEGATVESGPADAYGHRKLGGIGVVLGDALRARTGRNVIVQSLAYLMRAGRPVALDRMAATAFGTMTVQALADGETGRLMTLRGGRYETVPLEVCTAGEKRVDVAALYDTEAYRPSVRDFRGMPLFLY